MANEKKNTNREISGEDLFGDAGKQEVLEMVYNAKAAPKKDRFAGVKKVIARLKQEFALTCPPWEPNSGKAECSHGPNRSWVNPRR